MDEEYLETIYDSEIADMLTADDPLSRKYWPDIERLKSNLMKKNLGLFTRFLGRLFSPNAVGVRFDVNKSDQVEKGYIRMYRNDELIESKTFHKEGILPEEPQNDFEAVYEKLNQQT